MKRRNRKGFTLIEMMIVVLVIAVLALIVGLAVRNAGDRSRMARYTADKAAIENATTMYRNDTGVMPADTTLLWAAAGIANYQGPYLSRLEDPNCPFCAPGTVYSIDQATGTAECSATPAGHTIP